MEPPRSRKIAHSAVRENLVQITLDLVRRRGYDHVTLDDLAAETGVSRSTHLRYVGSKAEAVVSAVMAVGESIADSLRNRPPGEPTWVALRNAFEVAVAAHSDDADHTLTLVKVMRTNPALSGALWSERDTWRTALTDALMEREPGIGLIEAQANAAAALACLDVAVLAWADADGSASMSRLLDRSFDALAGAKSARKKQTDAKGSS